MQDKEFDQLFRSKLNDLEIEPSKTVWQGVNTKLSDNKRKKIIPFLSIAASIIVLIGAGVLFIPKKTAVVKPSAKNRIAIAEPKRVISLTVIKQQPVIVPKITLIATNNRVHLYHTSKNNLNASSVKQELTAKNELPASENDQQVLAAVSSSKNEVKQVSAIDTSTKLAVITPVLQNNTIAAVPDKQTETVPAVDKVTDAIAIKKHRIHGIGDLLNVVVAAVDKRKDKVIEFGDSDGDGASITAVNLGIIKLKKEN